MCDSSIQVDSVSTAQATTEPSSIGTIETTIFRECISMASNSIRKSLSKRYRNFVDTEQIAADVLHIIIRRFRNHHSLRQINSDSPIPVEIFIEIRSFFHRVKKCMVANAVRDAKAQKRGLGTLPCSLDGSFEPIGSTIDPAHQSEYLDTEYRLHSILDHDLQQVLRCRKSMMSNVEISKEMDLSLRSVVRLRQELKSTAQAVFCDHSPNKQTNKQTNGDFRIGHIIPF